MLESIFASNNYQAAKVMLDASEMRHKVMAGNLANVDTPGYKRLDISPSFRAELQSHISNEDTDRIAEMEMPVIEPENGLKATHLDGNNVSLDRELMLINQNAMEFQTMAKFVSSSLAQINMAITGRTQ